VDPREAARIGAQVADALAAAHAVGVLHRDVKPGNILLGRGGRVVLTDFGIATVDDPGDGYPSRLTHTGVLVGSLEYMAPERAQGDDPGPPSDVWSLGAALYAAVEGSSPFQRTSTWTTLTAIVTEPLPASRRCGPLLPVLRRLMEKDPQARPDAAEAAQLLAALYAAEAGSAVAVREAAPVAPVALESEPAAEPAAQPSPAEPVTSGSDTVPSRAAGRARGAGRRRTLVAVAAAGGVLAVASVTLAFVVGGGGDAPAGLRVAGGLNAADPQVRSSSAVTASASASPSSTSSPSSAAGGANAPGTTTASAARATASGAAPGGPVAATSAPATSAPATSAATSSAAASACTDAGGGTYDCTVIKAANSFDDDRNKVGVVLKGTRAFYCQADLGISRTRAAVTSTWWAKTDDDSGNSGVWITVTVVSGAVDNTPLSGLPTC
jgi:hypothetical protein